VRLAIGPCAHPPLGCLTTCARVLCSMNSELDDLKAKIADHRTKSDMKDRSHDERFDSIEQVAAEQHTQTRHELSQMGSAAAVAALGLRLDTTTIAATLRTDNLENKVTTDNTTVAERLETLASRLTHLTEKETEAEQDSVRRLSSLKAELTGKYEQIEGRLGSEAARLSQEQTSAMARLKQASDMNEFVGKKRDADILSKIKALQVIAVPCPLLKLCKQH
jgi:hypothetical protein